MQNQVGNPLVSIILPAFNNEGSLGLSVGSALAQTYENLEILIVDDCSSDATYSEALKIAALDKRVRVFRAPTNLGGAGARNIALEAAQGDWVAVLDADDRYASNRVQTLLKHASELSADVVCDELKIFDVGADSVIEETSFASGNATSLTTSLLLRSSMPTARYPLGLVKPFIRRSFLTQTGIRYRQEHRIAHDFLFLAELLLHNAKVWLIPQALYTYSLRWGPVSRSFSPHGRARGKGELLLLGCDLLKSEYGPTMSSEELRLLAHRRTLIQNHWRYLDAVEAVRARRWIDASRKLPINRHLLSFLAGSVMNRARTTILRYKLGSHPISSESRSANPWRT